MAAQLLTLDDLTRILKLSPATLRRWRARRRFPRPIVARPLRWSEASVAAWVRRRDAALNGER